MVARLHAASLPGGVAHWLRFPARGDPRLPFAALLALYLVLGTTLLGFNRSPAQILVTVAAAAGFDMLLHRLLRGALPPLFPLSAAITGMGLAILLNYAHGTWLGIVVAFVAVASKYLVTFDGRHVVNPALAGVVAALAVGHDWVSPSPAYRVRGGETALAAFIVTGALALFVFRVERAWLVGAFLVFYALQLALRAYATRWHVPPETIFFGALTAPAFYLFAFFMITDPATSPPRPRDQVLVAAAIVLVDLALHFHESLNTLFVAAFAVGGARWLWLHARRALAGGYGLRARLAAWLRRAAVVGAFGVPVAALGLPAGLGHRLFAAGGEPGFAFERVDDAHTGIRARPGTALDELDPAIAHVAKWILSVGDAVAVADVDGDGRQDLFFAHPLKDPGDRAVLYLNRGGFQFERFPIPALAARTRDARAHGLPSGALFFDWDNDGDPDLLVLAGFGAPVLLENRLVPDGRLGFVDATARAGLDRYGISVAATVLDYDRDGRLDLVVGHAFARTLPGYAAPTRFNPFALPPPEYPGDRRRFDFMHRTWHDANNGGGIELFRNAGGAFVLQPPAALGPDERRWTIAIGAADLDGDGWPDLYVANDFGPDRLLINRRDGGFAAAVGRVPGEIGRDTYKGMNVSIGDVDNNGRADVYVSNVHHSLQAEGSMLWMNHGMRSPADVAGWRDEAAARNALNERRFGWGAALGDLDRDGRLDIVQANGMVDDAMDRRHPTCPDYWYWNEKIALAPPDVHGYADRWADLRGRCIWPAERNRVYLARGRYFVDVAARVGLAEPGTARAVALADLDDDGALDLVVTRQSAPPQVFRNNARPAGWIGLALIGDGVRCNRDAIGSRVRIAYGADGATQWREVQGNSGLSAQGDRRVLFGLGEFAGTVRVAVAWCGGVHETTAELASGRYHALRLEAGR